MPEYKGKSIDGACERWLLTCEHPDFFEYMANKYQAEPVEIKGEIQMEDRKVPWSYWGVQAPDDQVRKVKKKLRERMITYGAVMNEFPCWLGCSFMDGEEE